jgi:hypothetical protein
MAHSQPLKENMDIQIIEYPYLFRADLKTDK